MHYDKTDVNKFSLTLHFKSLNILHMVIPSYAQSNMLGLEKLLRTCMIMSWLIINFFKPDLLLIF